MIDPGSYRVAQKVGRCMVSQNVVPKCANKASCSCIWGSDKCI